VSEVKYLSVPMVRTAHWLAQRRPALRFVMPIANSTLRARLERTLAKFAPRLDVMLLDGQSRIAMTAADAVLLASGTASLEAMLLKRPMVITFKSTELTFRIMKYWIGRNVRFAGLPNLLAGRMLVPELMQGDATPDQLGPPILDYLKHTESLAPLAKEFGRLHQKLRRRASEQAAEAVLELIRRNR